MTEEKNPLIHIDGLIDYAAIRPEHIAEAVQVLGERLDATVAKATAPETPATWEDVVEPLNAAVELFSRAWGAAGHLKSVMDTPALRDAYNAQLPAMTQRFIDLSQNEAQNAPK